MQVSDNMGITDKEKMISLAEELMKDAKLKERQVHKIRKYHALLLGYEIGVTMGKIREKYKRMMEIYHDSDVKFNKKFNLSPPGLRDLKPFHYILNMELMHTLEVDIDKLVHVLEVIPDDWHDSMYPGQGGPQQQQQPDQHPGGPFQNPGAPPGLRAGAVQDNYETISDELRASETRQVEQVKSHYREEHLMRKLGLPSNWTTTKKRFQDRWPVEDTWKLDQYY